MNIDVYLLKQVCTCLSVFVFSLVYIQEWIAGSYGSSVCNCLRKLHTVLQEHCTTTFQPTVYKWVAFSTPLAFILYMDYYGHSVQCNVIPSLEF